MDKLQSALDELGGIEINAGQYRAVQAVFQSNRAGSGVFVTGQAGTGKSTLIQIVVKMLELGNTPYQVTASTGIAALNIGGVTLHSFLGCGLASGSKDALVEHLNRKCNRFKVVSLRRLRVLIIDEVSMVLPEFFDKLDYVLRQVRSYQKKRPFGGLRVVMFGDFYQLPPIHSTEPKNGVYFCNQTEAWGTLNPTVIELTEHVRQEGDVDFACLLGRMRVGKMTAKDHETIESRIGARLELPDGVEPTRLYATNADVDGLNREKLKELKCPRRRYLTVTWTKGGCTEKQSHALRQGILSCLPVPESLEICKGSQVMFCANMFKGMVANGSRGVVVGFDFPPSGTAKNTSEALDMSTLFDDANRFQFMPNVQHPIVRFRKPNGSSSEMLVPFASWQRGPSSTSGMAKNKSVWACQIPLRLAWALTIHKSQGCTIDAAVVSTGDVFAPGQTYVAFSRVRSLDTISVQDYDRKKVFIHPCLRSMEQGEQRISPVAESRKRARPLPLDPTQRTCDAFFERWKK